MTRISKNRLDKSTSDRMFELFFRSLSSLNSSQAATEFFTDILTDTEQVMIAKRYTIAVLLTKGYNQTHIKQALNVSYTTIGTVAGWLKNLKPATKKIIDRHLKDEAWGQFFDKSAIGKAKFKATLVRSVRSALR
ncbi:MAG: Trp family transcriptional regulator [Patescibacteria group bacterium]|nr:Trp family transcriptional regulator [Candidatus Beckwithbacteria bacterium]MDZ4229117.1 Trp family transcriptional regulator [Patescibacteria group bacterium]